MRVVLPRQTAGRGAVLGARQGGQSIEAVGHPVPLVIGLGWLLEHLGWPVAAAVVPEVQPTA